GISPRERLTNATDVTRLFSRDKPYQCSQCYQALLHNNSLLENMMAHTGEIPYHCSQCDRAFSRNSNFTRHLDTHTRDKPYQCSQYDKAFSQNSFLVKLHQQM
ncbi:unnamed protein product, partial [Meganyctiphanes norvegica]